MRARVGKRWIVFGAAGLGLVAGALTLAPAPSGYTATGTGFASSASTSVGDVGSAALSAVRALPNIGRLATTAAVLEPVVRSLRLPETAEQLAGRVTAGDPEDTTLVTVSFTDPDPQRAVRIDGAVMRQLVTVAESAPQTGRVPVRLTVVAPPLASTSESTRNVPLALLAGTGTGAGIGVLLVLLPDIVRRRPAGGSLSAPSMV